jgi:hypothetical protein
MLFDGWFTALPESPGAVGSITRLVVRTGEDAFEDRDEIRVSVEGGVESDVRAPLVTVVNDAAILALADGDRAAAGHSGDQVHVHLALDDRTLPRGGILTIGSVILTLMPDTEVPDREFERALGRRAARRMRRHNRKGGGGRRLQCRVLAPGTIRLGDKVFPKSVGVRFQP